MNTGEGEKVKDHRAKSQQSFEFWKVKNGEGKAEIKLMGGLGSPDTLASCRGKKWKMRLRREYKEI